MSIFPAKILLATDGSREATLAARAAMDFSNKTGSELHIVHVDTMPRSSGANPLEAPLDPRYGPQVVPEAGDPGQPWEESGPKPTPQEFLDNQITRVREAGGEVAEAYLRAGRPAEEIIGLGEEVGTGLIVTGSRGLSPLKRLVMGSTSETVVRYVPCSVLIVREG